MAESLALKYRPRTFDDLVGQRAVQIFLRKMVATNKVPTALLFDGPRGTGKTTSLRIFTAALNCEAPPGPCGHCVSCKSVFAGTSTDLTEIDAASNGLVDHIRDLRQQVLYATGGNWHVIGLDEAHSMSHAAFNAALKMIEEPPPQTVFVLLTTEPQRIPDTVADRCMPFSFHRVAPADMITRLRQIRDTEQLAVDDDLLALIAERADGAMRNAVITLDQVSRAGIGDVDTFTELLGRPDAAPRLLAATLRGDAAAAWTCVDAQLARTGDPAGLVADLTAVLRDVLILHAGGTLARPAAQIAARQQLAAAVPAPQALAICRLLWDYATRIRPADDPRAGLDLVVALLLDQSGKLAAAAPAARKLSLAEMAARR